MTTSVEFTRCLVARLLSHVIKFLAFLIPSGTIFIRNLLGSSLYLPTCVCFGHC